MRRSSLGYAVLAGTLLWTTAPAALAVEEVSARVLKADLRPDGSIEARLALTCPKHSTFAAVSAMSQEFESNGGHYDAVAYSPAVTGTCTGKVQRIAARTTTSDRAPFQAYFGSTIPEGATRPTVGTVLLTVTAADGVATEHDFSNDIPLK